MQFGAPFRDADNASDSGRAVQEGGTRHLQPGILEHRPHRAMNERDDRQGREGGKRQGVGDTVTRTEACDVLLLGRLVIGGRLCKAVERLHAGRRFALKPPVCGWTRRDRAENERQNNDRRQQLAERYGEAAKGSKG